jgi:hypothetical protein
VKWQTQVLAQYIAATVPLEKAGDTNPLLESARNMFKDSEESKPPPKAEPQVGSFESFVSMFGGRPGSRPR